MEQSKSGSGNPRPFEQTNVAGSQVINNYFASETHSQAGKKGQEEVATIAGILMMVFSPFTLDLPPFSVMLAVTGLLLLPGIGRLIARVFRVRGRAALRKFALITLLLLNIPFAIAFVNVKLQSDAEHRKELMRKQSLAQQAELKDELRKDSLALCMQRIDSLHRKGELNKALVELDKADKLAKTHSEKADVNRQRIDVSLTKAEELTTKRRYNLAIDVLNEIYLLDTADAQILYRRAGCYVRINRMENAAHDAKRAMLNGHEEAGKLYEKINPVRKRIAFYTTLCNDGSTSSASGSGACSHHGGVATRRHAVYESYREYE